MTIYTFKELETKNYKAFCRACDEYVIMNGYDIRPSNESIKGYTSETNKYYADINGNVYVKY